jgi:hypothetical protein
LIKITVGIIGHIFFGREKRRKILRVRARLK